MKHTIYIETPLGSMGITENNNLVTEVFLGENDNEFVIQEETPLLQRACEQIVEYFSGVRRDFDLPFTQEGTDFQKATWDMLTKIPYGETRSYKQVAEMVGKPNASRAIGMANNKNALLILIPCHRVIGANGKLIGYAGGIEAKKKLLELEKFYVNR